MQGDNYSHWIAWCSHCLDYKTHMEGIGCMACHDKLAFDHEGFYMHKMTEFDRKFLKAQALDRADVRRLDHGGETNG